VQVPADLYDDEKHAYEQLNRTAMKRRAYALEMGTRPQTLYGIGDSPIGLACWLLDHGDGYVQPVAALTSAVFGRTVNGESSGAITNTGVSSARFTASRISTSSPPPMLPSLLR